MSNKEPVVMSATAEVVSLNVVGLPLRFIKMSNRGSIGELYFIGSPEPVLPDDIHWVTSRNISNLSLYGGEILENKFWTVFPSAT